MKVLSWIGARLKDLFYDPTNTRLDVGRVTATLSIASVLAAAVWNAHLGKEIDLGPGGLPSGLTMLLGAAAVYIIKDRQQNGA